MANAEPEPLFRVVAVRKKDRQRIVLSEKLTRERAERQTISLPFWDWELVIEPMPDAPPEELAVPE